MLKTRMGTCPCGAYNALMKALVLADQSSPNHAGWGVLFCYTGSASAGIEIPEGGTMQRIIQALTILTLLILTPALAQSSQSSLKPTNPALVLPVGQELSDAELSQIEGKWLWAIGGAVVSIAAGYAEKAAAGEAYTWKDAAKDAIAGAMGTGIGKAAGMVGKAVERAIYVPRGTGNAVEFAGGAVGTGTVRGALDRRP
jgi:hypothetical protein